MMGESWPLRLVMLEKIVYWLGFLVTLFLVWEIAWLFVFAIQECGWTVFTGGDRLWVLQVELFLYVPLSVYFLIRTCYDRMSIFR